MDVSIDFLGRFAVTVDGRPVPAEAWTRRNAAGLVKALALTSGRRLHREQLIDKLWPDTPPDVAAPRLHKAAHYARRALGGDQSESVLLRNDVVSLFPGANVDTDVDRFRALAQAALSSESTERATEALSLYGGPLLPDDLYEPWAQDYREALRGLHLDLLRMSSRWEELVREDPLDEAAHLALVREHADRGDIRSSLRQFERMDQALRNELGTAPSPEAEELRGRLLKSAQRGTPRPDAPAGIRLVGRRPAADLLRARIAQANEGRGSTVLVTGSPGVGKSAMLDLAVALARQEQWRVGRGTASAVEGSWPYAPVLEALSDLCRAHPALLDGLGDNFRNEIDRALSGREATWSGESAHQRLFLATAELLRLAAAGPGFLLVVDDIHEADEASLRLLHYLARCAVTERALLLLAFRPDDGEAIQKMGSSLRSRGIGVPLHLMPLDEGATTRLLTHQFPSLDKESRSRIWAVSGGLPFRIIEIARAAESGSDEEPPLDALFPAPALRTLQRVALLGMSFSTDEMHAVAGVDEDEAYAHLEVALSALVVEPAPTGYRFRHALLREGLLSSIPVPERAGTRREVAEQLAALGAAPARVAHFFLASGHPAQAIPHVLPAVETAGALGAYRDALDLVDAVRNHAHGEELGHLLARRGDLLMALADPESVSAYQAAVPATVGTENRLVRARLARACSFVGDFETARTALTGLELQGDDADGPILLARGNLAYFSGDVDTAWDAAVAAGQLPRAGEDPWYYVDLMSLQGLIAHQRGEWFERFRQELRRTNSKPGLATALFDAHLCVAEYLLYGPVPYTEVIELAEGLRTRATHAGALRGIAFATSLIGEAALLMGDLGRAERELQEAVDLHRDVDAAAGESHSLQRLAEVRLAQGKHAEAQQLLQRALPLARWSAVSKHLLQRIYGTMIASAPDAASARIIVDKAAATMGATDTCPFCDIMLAAPAAIACANVGDVDTAARYLSIAETSAARWEGTAWEAAVLEARAHLAKAQGQDEEFLRLIDQALDLFTIAGQPLDVERIKKVRRNARQTC